MLKIDRGTMDAVGQCVKRHTPPGVSPEQILRELDPKVKKGNEDWVVDMAMLLKLLNGLVSDGKVTTKPGNELIYVWDPVRL